MMLRLIAFIILFLVCLTIFGAWWWIIPILIVSALIELFRNPDLIKIRIE